MAQRNPDTIFHIVNFNVYKVLQSGLVELQKFSSAKNVTDQTFLFLRYITCLVEHAIARIQKTAAAEELQQIHYRKLWYENKKILKKISALSKTREHERNLRQQIEGRINSQHVKNNELVEKIDKKCLKDIKTLSITFERMQINEYKQSAARQNDLDQIFNITQNKLQNVLTTNERLEEEIYSERLKITSQYLSLINRYDTEIGERQTIIAELKAKFDRLNEERHQLQDTIEKQSDIFNLCIHTIRADKIKEFSNRIKLSRKINAVKIIQQWWRSITNKGKKKKKKKKRKGKTRRKRKKLSP